MTGYNQFELQEPISESLAGRTDIFNMESLSFAEIFGYNDINIFIPNIEILKEKKNHTYRSRREIFEDIYKGGMPEYIAKNIIKQF